jgi:myosin heavy subunit
MQHLSQVEAMRRMHVSRTTFSKWLVHHDMKWNYRRPNNELALQALNIEKAAGSTKGMGKNLHNHVYRSACRLKPG